MEEARKPFEYDEDKRGPILYFVAMIITADVLGAIICIMQTDDIINQVVAFSFIYKAIGTLFIISIPVLAVMCYKLKRSMVKISKIYLIVRAIYMASAVVILFIQNMKVTTLIIGPDKKYETLGKFIGAELILPIVCVVITSAAWFMYFMKSRRCKKIAVGQVNEIN